MNGLRRFYNRKKVFITGHSGFKGSWLTAVLLSFGARVKGYALPPEELSLFNILGHAAKIDNVFADVRDGERLRAEIAAFAPDIVIHLAAQPLVLESYNDPVGTYSTNVMGTVNLLEACRAVPGIRSVLNVTTDKVYENTERTAGYREEERLCGRDPYSNSKSCSELVTHSYRLAFYSASDSPALSSARSGNVIGGGDFARDRIIPDCVRAALAGKEIFLRNPDSVRPYQHVLETLRGYLMLIAAQYDDRNVAGAFNFGPDDDDCATTGRLADLFCAAWGNAVWSVRRTESAPHEASLLKLDCAKAKSVLNWYPRLNIGDAVKLTVEWSLAHSAGRDKTGEQIEAYFNAVQ